MVEKWKNAARLPSDTPARASIPAFVVRGGACGR